jgi:hypothetical protein
MSGFADASPCLRAVTFDRKISYGSQLSLLRCAVRWGQLFPLLVQPIANLPRHSIAHFVATWCDTLRTIAVAPAPIVPERY